jgi:hypothetical protein
MPQVIEIGDWNMVYIVYKTTNNINGKIYIGMHKQEDNNFDGYYGSGVILNLAIEKYGINNFSRETLLTYDDLESARNKERELVTAEFCLLRDNYNVSAGGIDSNSIAGYDEAKKKLIRDKIYATNILNNNYEYKGKS